MKLHKELMEDPIYRSYVYSRYAESGRWHHKKLIVNIIKSYLENSRTKTLLYGYLKDIKRKLKIKGDIEKLRRIIWKLHRFGDIDIDNFNLDITIEKKTPKGKDYKMNYYEIKKTLDK